MLRSSLVLATLALIVASPAAATAAGIDDLKGSFAFDWLKEPSKATCVEVGSELLASFKSADFTCDLTAHPTSGEATAKMCSKVGGGSEYLIFDTRADCEEERETQSAAE